MIKRLCRFELYLIGLLSSCLWRVATTSLPFPSRGAKIRFSAVIAKRMMLLLLNRWYIVMQGQRSNLIIWYLLCDPSWGSAQNGTVVFHSSGWKITATVLWTDNSAWNERDSRMLTMRRQNSRKGPEGFLSQVICLLSEVWVINIRA